MKKYIYSLALASCLFSCSDFLNEESKSQMTTDYYYTEKGLEEGVAAIYSSCREVFRENMFRINEFSDIAEWGSSDPDNGVYGAVANPGRGVFNSLFCDLHQGIMIANRMEQVLGESPETRVNEIYLAEVKCFRAMFYQYLVELWGRYGHFQDQVFDKFDDAMLYINQVPVETYYKQILEDIDFAIAKLPKQSEISDFGRFSQGAAKALKAKFLLAIAGYTSEDYAGEEEHNLHTKLGFSSESQLYTEARNLAKDVIAEYPLCAKYADNFDETQQTNSEVIWSVQWTQEMLYNGDAPGYHRYGIGRSCEMLTSKMNSDGSRGATTSTLSVTRNGKSYTFPCHSMYYGREYRYYMPSFKWLTMYSDKDQRKYDCFENVFLKIDDDKAAPANMTDTIVYMPFRAITMEEDKAHADWVASGAENAYYLDGMNEVYDMDDPNDTEHYGGPLRHRSRYYNVKKFYDRSRIEKGKQEEGTKNGTVIRAAEMHLINAECTFRLGEGENAVYEALKPLWTRAFDNIADADVYKTAPGTMDINFIIDEYWREVGMEFNAFFILKRTHTLVDRISKMPQSKEEAADNKESYASITKKYGKYLYVKPFPLSQAKRYKEMSREMLPPGYDYGSNF